MKLLSLFWTRMVAFCDAFGSSWSSLSPDSCFHLIACNNSRSSRSPWNVPMWLSQSSEQILANWDDPGRSYGKQALPTSINVILDVIYHAKISSMSRNLFLSCLDRVWPPSLIVWPRIKCNPYPHLFSQSYSNLEVRSLKWFHFDFWPCFFHIRLCIFFSV